MSLRAAEWPLMLQSFIGYVGVVWALEAVTKKTNESASVSPLLAVLLGLTCLSHGAVCMYIGLRIQERMHQLRDVQNRLIDLIHFSTGYQFAMFPSDTRTDAPIHSKWYAFVPFVLGNVVAMYWVVGVVAYRAAHLGPGLCVVTFFLMLLGANSQRYGPSMMRVHSGDYLLSSAETAVSLYSGDPSSIDWKNTDLFVTKLSEAREKLENSAKKQTKLYTADEFANQRIEAIRSAEIALQKRDSSQYFNAASSFKKLLQVRYFSERTAADQGSSHSAEPPPPSP